MFIEMADALERFIYWVKGWFPEGHMLADETNLSAMLAVLLVSFTCGAIGSLVVGQRMAFFSDALAHCSFAGVALGLLIGLVLGASSAEFRQVIILIMVTFGILVGLLMVFVQEKSGLPSDTVIGVFFAGALGLGAIFVKTTGGRGYFNLESFLFGSLYTVKSWELLALAALMLVTWLFLYFGYNTIVFSSFNVSLAASRQLPARLCKYGFVALLGLVVNLSLHVVGALLVNAILIVPAATAANITRNMRQLFWTSILLSLLAGWGGTWLAWEIRFPDPLFPSKEIQYGLGGVIVITSVFLFVLSLLWKGRRRAA
jgi:zinc transport system permease protein